MVFESLTKTDVYIGLILNGIMTGFAVAIGNYLDKKHFIDGLRKLFNFKKRKKK